MSSKIVQSRDYKKMVEIMVSFAGEVPENIKKVFTDLADDKIGEVPEETVDTLINDLKAAVELHPNVKVGDIHLWKKLKPLKATEVKRKEVCQLILKIAFGADCPVPQAMDDFISNEFKMNKSLSKGTLSGDLNFASQALLLLPLSQRSPEIICHFNTIFKDLPEGAQLEMLKSLEKIAADRLSEVIQQLADVQEAEERTALLEFEVSILPGERADVMKQSATLLRDINNGLQRANILKAVAEIPANEREKTIMLSLPLMKGVEDGSKKAAILIQLSSICPELQPKVQAVVLPLIAESKDSEGIIPLLKAVDASPLLEREALIELAQPLIKEVKNGAQRAAIIKTLSDIHSRNRKRVIDLALPFVNGIDDGNGIASLLEALNLIHPHDALDVVRKTTAFIAEVEKGDHAGKVKALEAIAALPARDRENVLEQSKPLLEGITKAAERAAIVDAVGAIHRSERAAVIELALPLIQDVPCGCVRADILDCIAAPEPKRRPKIAALSTPLFDGLEDSQGKKEILHAVNALQFDSAPEIIRHATPLIKHVKKGAERADILKSVGGLPASERANVIEISLPLAGQISDGTQIAACIEAIGSIKSAERPAAVAKAVSLFTNEKWVSANIDILRALGSLSQIERAEVVELSEALWKGIEDIGQRASILNAVKNLPADARKYTADLSLTLVKDIKDGGKRAVLLKALGGIPKNGMAEVLELSMTLLRDISEADYKADILQAMGSYISPCRREIFELVQILLDRVDRKTLRAAHLNALNEIPATERASTVKLALPLVGDIRDLSGKLTVIKALLSIAPNQRGPVAEKTAAFIFGCIDGEEIASIIKALGECVPEERERLLQLAFLVKNLRIKRGEIIAAAAKIRPQERDDVFRHAKPLLKGESHGGLCAQILSSISKIHRSRREDVIALSESVCSNHAEKAEVLDYVNESIPPASRREIISKVLEFFKTDPKSSYKFPLLKLLNRISEEEIDPFLDAASPLMDKLRTSKQRYELLLSLAGIPKPIRMDLLKKALQLNRGKINSDLYTLIKGIKDLNHSELDQIISAAHPLIFNETEGWSICNLIQEIAQIPAEERGKIVRQAIELAPQNKWYLVRELLSIPREDRDEVVRLALPLYSGRGRLDRLINIIARIPKPQRANLVQAAAPLLMDANPAFVPGEKLPLEQFQDAVNHIVPYLSEINGSQDFYLFLSERLCSLPAEERGPAIKRWVELAGEFGKKQSAVFRAIVQTPVEDWDDVKQRADDLSRCIGGTKSNGELAAIYVAVSLIPPNERSSFIELCRPLVNGLKNCHIAVQIIETLLSLPFEQRNETIRITQPLMQGLSPFYWADMFKMVKKIPYDERKAYIGYILPALNGLSDGYECISMITRVLNMPQGHLVHCIKAAIPFFGKLSYYENRCMLLEAIMEISHNHREKVIALAASLMPAPPHDTDSCKTFKGLIETIGAFNPEEIEDVVKRAASFRHGVHSIAEIRTTLEVLSKIKPEDRESFVSACDSTLSRRRNRYNNDHVIVKMAAISPEDRQNVIDRAFAFADSMNAPIDAAHLEICRTLSPEESRQVYELSEPLLDYGGWGFSNTQILENVAAVVKQGRNHVIKFFQTSILEEVNGYDKARSLQVLARVPLEERAEFAKIASLVVSKVISCRGEVFMSLLKIPQHEREEVLGKTLPLFNSGIRGHEAAALINLVRLIPAEQREELVKKTLFILGGIPAVNDDDRDGRRSRILDALRVISLEEREDVFRYAWPMIKGISRVQTLVDIMSAVQKVSPEQRDEVLKTCRALLTGASQDRWHLLIQAIANTHPQKRGTGIMQLEPLIACARSIDEQVDIFYVWSHFPDDQRGGIIPESLLELQDKLGLNIAYILKVLLMIAPSVRLQAIKLALEIPELSKKTPLHYWFRNSQEIRKKSHAYLLQILEKLSEDPIRSHRISKWVFEFAQALHLHESHPVYQKVLATLCVTDPDAKLNRKNPFNLYQRLKKIHAEEPWMPFKPKPTDINGKTVSVRLEKLRQMAADEKSYTIADLPEGVPADGFEKIYTGLEIRLKELPEHQRLSVERYIIHSFEIPLNELKDKFLNKPLVYELMNVAGEPEQPIEAASYYLHMILLAVLEQDSKLAEGMLLSPQEELLLRIFRSIGQCPAGFRDGIILYRNSLPYKYRGERETRAMRAAEAKLLNLLKQSIEKKMLDIFGSKQFIKEAAHGEYVSEIPHQALFLKNRLFSQVGLRKHTVTFDLHSGVIMDAVLDAKLPDLLEAFFKLFTPQEIIAQFRLDLVEFFKSKSLNYMDLYNSLEVLIMQQLQIQALNPELIQKYLTVGEDYAPLGVTVEGALLLLMGFEIVDFEGAVLLPRAGSPE